MKITLDIPACSAELGLRTVWIDDPIISTVYEDFAFVISTNKDGLISLATHLLTLAQDSVSSGCHIHYDDLNSLEAGSAEMIIIKTE